MELILENLPEHYEEATEAAERLHLAATEQRDTEKQERQIRRDREKAEALEAKKRLEEAKKYNLEETPGGGETWGEQIIPPPKKPKTKIVNKKDSEGWVTATVVDEAGKAIEKPKAEEKAFEKPPKPKKVKVAPKNNDSTLSNNIFNITDEMENLPSQSEYQSSLRENKLKGQQEKPPKNKVPRKQVENKENGEKAKESVDNKKLADKIKKNKEEKKKDKKPKEEKKKGSHQAAVKDVPFWQNDTFKPLVYVFAFVALISVLYLTLN
jgi:hypothetical protein